MRKTHATLPSHTSTTRTDIHGECERARRSDKQLARRSRWTTAHSVNWIMDSGTQDAQTALRKHELMRPSVHNSACHYVVEGAQYASPVSRRPRVNLKGEGEKKRSVCEFEIISVWMILKCVCVCCPISAVQWSGAINRGHLSYLITDRLP